MKGNGRDPSPAETASICHALDSAAIVSVTDTRGTITFANARCCEISGYSREELVGSNHRMIASGLHDAAFFREMYRRIAAGKVWRGEICNRHRDGHVYWVDTTIVPRTNGAGKVDSYTAIRFDITAKREAEQRLHQAASIDSITGLANRAQFQERLETALRSAEEHGAPVHLALLDVDAFQEINDTLGHDQGDELLRLVSNRLTLHTPPGTFIARLGGDEFGLIFTGQSPDNVLSITETVLARLRDPVELASATRRCSASIGIATFPEHAQSLDDLLKAADMALYRSKALGRDRASVFVPRLRTIAKRKSELLSAVETGLAAGQFRLYYQPIVAADPHADTVSLEGLLRWKHPEQGAIYPGDFLQDLKDSVLQAAIGLFVVEQAFNDLKEMIEQDLPVARVAVNVTNADFRSDVFVDRFFALSRKTRIPPNRFCIEITEGVFLGRDFQHVEGRLTRLHEAGVEIALDDFGTGFASLTHLRRIPIARIKIDRSFVSNITTSAEDRAIVKGVIDIAHGMGKVVTAEGVETQQHADLLRDLGCDSLQGWHFSKAHSLERLPWAITNIPRLPPDPGRAAAGPTAHPISISTDTSIS